MFSRVFFGCGSFSFLTSGAVDNEVLGTGDDRNERIKNRSREKVVANTDTARLLYDTNAKEQTKMTTHRETHA